MNQKETVYPQGMKMDPATGTLSGTLDKAGRLWEQVQVAPGERQLGSARNYLLIVEP